MDSDDNQYQNEGSGHSAPAATLPTNSIPQSFNEALESYNEAGGNAAQTYEDNHASNDYNSNNQTYSQNGQDNGSYNQGSNDDQDNSGSTLYVSKLSFKTTEQTLLEEFSKHGKVSNCHLVVDPHTKDSRGFAFVTFEKAENADIALANSTDLRLDGVQVLVEKSRRSKPRSPTPGRYSGSRPLHRSRLGTYDTRRDYYRPPGRDFDDRPRAPYPRDYPPRDFHGVRDRPHGYPSRYGDREPFGPDRPRDRNFDRPPPPRNRDFYPRENRGPYPPRDPRDIPGGYPRDIRDPRDTRGFRGPVHPRERYPDYPRSRDPRGPPPFEREREPFRPRDGPVPDRYRDERAAPYPAPREHRPRYDY